MRLFVRSHRRQQGEAAPSRGGVSKCPHLFTRALHKGGNDSCRALYSIQPASPKAIIVIQASSVAIRPSGAAYKESGGLNDMSFLARRAFARFACRNICALSSTSSGDAGARRVTMAVPRKAAKKRRGVSSTGDASRRAKWYVMAMREAHERLANQVLKKIVKWWYLLVCIALP